MYYKFQQKYSTEIVWVDENKEKLKKLLKEYQEGITNKLNYDYLDDFLLWLFSEHNIQSEYFKYNYDIDIRVNEVK